MPTSHKTRRLLEAICEREVKERGFRLYHKEYAAYYNADRHTWTSIPSSTLFIAPNKEEARKLLPVHFAYDPERHEWH